MAYLKFLTNAKFTLRMLYLLDFTKYIAMMVVTQPPMTGKRTSHFSSPLETPNPRSMNEPVMMIVPKSARIPKSCFILLINSTCFLFRKVHSKKPSVPPLLVGKDI